MFRVKCAPGYEFQPGGCVPVVHIDFMERRPDSVPVGYYVQANGRTATKDGYDYAESWTVAQISQDTSLWGRVIDTAIVGLATAVNPVAGGIAKLVIASNNAPGPRPIRTAVPVPKPCARNGGGRLGTDLLQCGRNDQAPPAPRVFERGYPHHQACRRVRHPDGPPDWVCDCSSSPRESNT